VLDYLAALRDEPDQLEAALQFVSDNVGKFDGSRQIVDYFLSLPDSIARTVGCIGIIGDLAERHSSSRVFSKALERLLERGDRPLICAGSRVAVRTALGSSAFAKLKYDTEHIPPGSFDIAARGRSLSRRIWVDEQVLRFIYRKAAPPRMRFGDWKRQVYLACGLEEAARDCGRLGTAVMQFIKNDEDIFEKSPRGRKGEVVLVHHGGFMSPKLAYFVRNAENGVVFASKQQRTRHVIAAASPRTALLAAYRSLSGGEKLYIGLDARNGSAFQSVSVLGIPVQLGAGAAFAAYEASSLVSWYGMRWDGVQFAPWKVSGPQRVSQESFAAYSGRFFQFYVSHLENYFTSEPHNMSLLPFWIGNILAFLNRD
jgi:hypothetical protein